MTKAKRLIDLEEGDYFRLASKARHKKRGGDWLYRLHEKLPLHPKSVIIDTELVKFYMPNGTWVFPVALEDVTLDQFDLDDTITYYAGYTE